MTITLIEHVALDAELFPSGVYTRGGPSTIDNDKISDISQVLVLETPKSKASFILREKDDCKHDEGDRDLSHVC